MVLQKMSRNKILAIILIVFSLIMWFYIIPTQVCGPKEAMFPKIVTVWLIVNSIILLLRYPSEEKREKIISPNDKLYSKKILIIFFVFLIYIILIYYFGFFPSSFIFLITIMMVLGMGIKDWKKMMVTTSVFLFFIYLVVERLLSFRLIRGIYF